MNIFHLHNIIIPYIVEINYKIKLIVSFHKGCKRKFNVIEFVNKYPPAKQNAITAAGGGGDNNKKNTSTKKENKIANYFTK